MAKITYLLGAGASYYSCPILEKQAEMMIKVAKHEIKDFHDGIKFTQPKFNIEEKAKIPTDDKTQILWHIGYFGKKAQEYNTIDTYARKLFLNNEINELRLLKMSVSVFFDLWENFYFDGIGFPDTSDYVKIDNRYKSLFSVLLDNVAGEIKLNDEFKFISWNYDLQLEKTFGMFLAPEKNDLNSINKSFRFKEIQDNDKENNVYHLNGHRGYFTNTKSSNENEELQLKISNNKEEYWNKITGIIDLTLRGMVKFDNYIKYAWEHNLDDIFFKKISKVMEETEILVIIGYSFPAFNRKIDQFLFSKLVQKKLKKIVYQDPNANVEIIKNLFTFPTPYEKIIYTLNDGNSLKQFYMPNEHFISQIKHNVDIR